MTCESSDILKKAGMEQSNAQATLGDNVEDDSL